MNYEELLTDAIGCEKEISDVMRSQSRLYKSLCKNLEKGDLKNAVKDLTPIESLCYNLEVSLAKLRDLIENFNGREYMENGEFSEQMLEYCKKMGVDAVGEGASYEMFPYKVRIDMDNLDVYVDRKKFQCFRPQSLISDIKNGQDKLLRVPFNAVNFADELADAYDLALLKQSKGEVYAPDKDCSLINLYKYLTPMKRFRKDYDRQSYAFDLARLYSLNVESNISISDGRKIQFGPARDIKKSIRILDLDGNEHFLTMIRFY